MENLIQGEAYSVAYDSAAATVAMKGMMRLNGTEEYAAIAGLLSRAIGEQPAVVLDIRELEFLNSSGIAMLSKFVIEARNRATAALTIRGAKTIAWQGKSLVNLQRLMPALTMELA
jgi:hypothetical protein